MNVAGLAGYHAGWEGRSRKEIGWWGYHSRRGWVSGA